MNKDEKTKDPIAPEKVLFGLIFVSLAPLNNLPIIKPPMSENAQVSKIIKIKIFI